MSDNIYFDNIIVTDNLADAKEFAAQTFDLKVLKVNKGMVSISVSVLFIGKKNSFKSLI